MWASMSDWMWDLEAFSSFFDCALGLLFGCFGWLDFSREVVWPIHRSLWRMLRREDMQKRSFDSSDCGGLSSLNLPSVVGTKFIAICALDAQSREIRRCRELRSL